MPPYMVSVLKAADTVPGVEPLRDRRTKKTSDRSKEERKDEK